MKIIKTLLTLILCCLLCCCQLEKTEEIEIESHVFVEKEFADSWLEKCDERTYVQFVLEGGYNYQTNQEMLDIFFKNGGKIELYNYSIKKDNMIISGEFIADKTIRLMHPNLDGIISDGVLMHELGHYFDYRYHFSDSQTFQQLYKGYSQEDDKEEFFAELFKEYNCQTTQIPLSLKEYMKGIYKKILDRQKV